MKDLNNDYDGNGWHLFYGEKTLGNRQYYTTFIQRRVANAHTGHDKNGLKRKMLEHDAIFKNQVYELHRLYRTQRDMMREIKIKGEHRHGDLFAPSSSSILQGSQSKNHGKWHISSYPIDSSVRSSVSGTGPTTSPLSCSKRKDILSSHVPLQNKCCKDYEVSEDRPLKVRKKFDLQLPADKDSDKEYTEQEDTKTFNLCRLTSNQGNTARLENTVKLSNGDFVIEKKETLQGRCNSVSNTKISIGLADLNEPVEVEESPESSSIKIFGHSARNSAVDGIDISAKPNSGFRCSPKDATQKPGHDWHDSLHNFITEDKVNANKWLPFSYKASTESSYKAEHAEGNNNLASGSAQQDILSFPGTLSKVLSQDCHTAVHFEDHSKKTPVKEIMPWGLERFHRCQDYANNTGRQPMTGSHPCKSYPFLGSSDVVHAIPHILSPIGKPADSLSQKFTLSHSQNSSKGLIKTLQSSALNNDISGEKWYFNNCSHSSTGLPRDLASFNEFYHGSSSGSKDYPIIGFDHIICSRRDNITTSGLVNHGTEKAYKVSSCSDVKPLKEFNLNKTLPRNAMKEPLLCRDPGIIDGESQCGYRKPLFPWLREKPAFKNEAENPEKNVISISSNPPRASQSSLYGKSETGRDQELKGMFNTSYSMNYEIWPKNDRYETECVKKFLGVPIFERLGALENEAASLASSIPERENANDGKENFLIDINVACDASLLISGDNVDLEEVIVEKPLDKTSRARNFIDLNSYATEDDDLLVPSAAKSNAPMIFLAHFNLEEPAVPEEWDIMSEKEKEQNISTQLQNCEFGKLDGEVLMSAAESIVYISSCQDEIQEIRVLPLPDVAELDSLLWFANVASSVEKLENRLGKGCSIYNDMDDFEALTLLLPNTTEEDYMPKALVPEFQVEETGGNVPPTRPRRGQARRGRQRRDFQRDILPGLATLSRHEMTEDLQTFGGLMRATGHAWNSGSTKKNAGTRGRRRKAVELIPDTAQVTGCTKQSNNVEIGLDDRKSLTGWGKTTRRPRRQRCPASNAPAVALF